MGANGRGKRRKRRIGLRIAAADRIERTRETREPRVPLGRAGIAFVGDVVGGAREMVDRGNRAPVARRQQEGGDREVLVMPDGQGTDSRDVRRRGRIY